MRACGFGRIAMYLLVAVLSIVLVPTASSARGAAGGFEVYCDGIGFSLANVEGAPAPKTLFLFLYTGFPGYPYWVQKQEWKDVYVYRGGCAADGKCDVLTHGGVWLDHEITPDGRHVSGKYEIELGGQPIRGQFATSRRVSRHVTRIC